MGWLGTNRGIRILPQVSFPSPLHRKLDLRSEQQGVLQTPGIFHDLVLDSEVALACLEKEIVGLLKMALSSNTDQSTLRATTILSYCSEQIAKVILQSHRLKIHALAILARPDAPSLQLARLAAITANILTWFPKEACGEVNFLYNFIETRDYSVLQVLAALVNRVRPDEGAHAALADFGFCDKFVQLWFQRDDVEFDWLLSCFHLLGQSDVFRHRLGTPEFLSSLSSFRRLDYPQRTRRLFVRAVLALCDEETAPFMSRLLVNAGEHLQVLDADEEVVLSLSLVTKFVSCSMMVGPSEAIGYSVIVQNLVRGNSFMSSLLLATLHWVEATRDLPGIEDAWLSWADGVFLEVPILRYFLLKVALTFKTERAKEFLARSSVAAYRTLVESPYGGRES